jgi:hypothetical protein
METQKQPQFKIITNQDDLESLIPGDEIRLASSAFPKKNVRFYKKIDSLYVFAEKVEEDFIIYSSHVNYIGIPGNIPPYLETAHAPSGGLTLNHLYTQTRKILFTKDYLDILKLFN